MYLDFFIFFQRFFLFSYFCPREDESHEAKCADRATIYSRVKGGFPEGIQCALPDVLCSSVCLCLPIYEIEGRCGGDCARYVHEALDVSRKHTAGGIAHPLFVPDYEESTHQSFSFGAQFALVRRVCNSVSRSGFDREGICLQPVGVRRVSGDAAFGHPPIARHATEDRALPPVRRIDSARDGPEAPTQRSRPSAINSPWL